MLVTMLRPVKVSQASSRSCPVGKVLHLHTEQRHLGLALLHTMSAAKHQFEVLPCCIMQITWCGGLSCDGYMEISALVVSRHQEVHWSKCVRMEMQKQMHSRLLRLHAGAGDNLTRATAAGNISFDAVNKAWRAPNEPKAAATDAVKPDDVELTEEEEEAWLETVSASAASQAKDSKEAGGRLQSSSS